MREGTRREETEEGTMLTAGSCGEEGRGGDSSQLGLGGVAEGE